MPHYRRAKSKGGCYFFTVVTYKRQKIFSLDHNRDLLRKTIKEVKQIHPFKIDAWVLLPEHMHCIWTLPKEDSDYSKRWGIIKARFTKDAKCLLHNDALMNASKTKHRESTVWQRRFWEHEIRDETDYQKHMDYIHYNPVKHKIVTQTKDWPYSTFHRYVKQGIYDKEWGVGEKFNFENEFGE